MGSPFYPRFHASDAGQLSVGAFTVRRRRILTDGLSSAGVTAPITFDSQGKDRPVVVSILANSTPSSVGLYLLPGALRLGKEASEIPVNYAAAVTTERGR